MKAMIIDIARCNGCFNCQIACKDEHVDNDWSPYAKPQPDTGHFWMNLKEIERGQYPKVKVAYVASPCMHCQYPQCIKSAQGGAVYKRQDGIVMIDPVKSKGQKQIVDTCPYGAIYWNEELNIPQKCTFCAHLLDKGWKKPRCVEACPTDAIIFGEYEDLKDIITNKKAEVMSPELGTQPVVYYIGLPKKFVAGSIALGDKNECAENVSVTLIGKNIKRTTKTDNYGDFEFEDLPDNKAYTVKIQYPGYAPKLFRVNTKTDVYLGEIVLT